MSDRLLKIHKRYYKGRETIPEIILKGKWLDELGFKSGEFVDVIYKDGCINITHRCNNDIHSTIDK